MDSSRRILVVDDDRTVLMNLAVYLEDEGFTVLSVSTAEAALKALAENPRTGIAILDIRLAGMGGEAFVGLAHAENPALRFVIHTGTAGYALPAELKRIGIRDEDVLLKPLADLRMLRDAIDRVSAGRSNVSET